MLLEVRYSRPLVKFILLVPYSGPKADWLFVERQPLNKYSYVKLSYIKFWLGHSIFFFKGFDFFYSNFGFLYSNFGLVIVFFFFLRVLAFKRIQILAWS
jgi:hypothetical protein